MPNFNLDDYIPVNDRIAKFYSLYPEGGITTEIVKDEDNVVQVKAYVFKEASRSAAATGHAEELRGSSFINKTSALENCETSAVGRALAMLGIEISKSVASREEVANAKLNQDKPKLPLEPPELVKPELVQLARDVMKEKNLTGEEAKNFLQMVIDKDIPTTKRDYEMIIEALSDEA